MADLGSSLASLLQIPGLQELMNQSITQQRQNSALHTGIMQQAANMLPNSAWGPPNMSGIPAANYSTPPPSSGFDWTKLLTLLAAGGATGGALAKVLGGGSGGSSGGNLSNLVGGLKKLFGRGTLGSANPTVTGGNPFGDNLPSYDNMFNWTNFDPGPGGFTGLMADPSQGTGIGPGMQAYYGGGGGEDGSLDDGYGE